MTTHPARTTLAPMAAAALAAGGLALLGALQSVVWHGADAPAGALAVAARLDPGLLVEAASSELAQPSESYFGYGRWTLSAYALLWIAAAGLRPTLPPRTRWPLGALLALATLGDAIAYWLSEWTGPGVRALGFWYTELPALLILTVAVTGVGARALLRRERGGALALALPLSLATTASLGYLPHGLLLGLALTWLVALTFARVSTPAVASASSASAAPGAAGAAPRARRGRLVIVGGVLAVLLLAPASMYRPDLQPGPDATGQATASAANDALRGARVHVFNTGYNRMSWWLVGRERPWRPVPAFVLELSNGRLVVFDTGFSDAVAELGEAGLHAPERWVIESRSNPDWTLPAQMRAAGLAPEAVAVVVVSHLHGDHVGQLDAFPGATILGGPGSAGFARAHGLDARWREVSFEAGAGVGPFGSVDQTRVDSGEVTGGPGLVFVRDGGHAREGLMWLLPLDAGPLLLAGDAVVHSDWLRSNDVQRIVVDGPRAAAVRNEVRAFLADAGASSVVYGHDLRDVDCARPDIVCHAAGRFTPEPDEEPVAR